MNIHGNTILITGGSTGIGLALAKVFVRADNTVLICGRSESRLKAAKELVPELQVRVCDVSQEAERRSLVEWIGNEFPNFNILVNNAGIQRQIDLKAGLVALDSQEDEIAINLPAPIWLTAALIPHLLQQPQAAIVNVSSGLAYVPMTAAPIYCATKAALHSFSQSLRHQLRDTSIQVFEVIPPAVDTNLDRGARQERSSKVSMISPEAVALATLQGLANNTSKIRVEKAQFLYYVSRFVPQLGFRLLNRLTQSQPQP